MKLFCLLLFFVGIALAAILLFTEFFAPHEFGWWIADFVIIAMSVLMMGITEDGFDLFDGWDEIGDFDGFSGGDFGDFGD